MWLGKHLQKPRNSETSGGYIAGNIGGSPLISGEQQRAAAGLLSPFGVRSSPPAGTKVTQMETSSGTVCAGALSALGNLSPGDIAIKSAGQNGAMFKSDGQTIITAPTELNIYIGAYADDTGALFLAKDAPLTATVTQVQFTGSGTLRKRTYSLTGNHPAGTPLEGKGTWNAWITIS